VFYVRGAGGEKLDAAASGRVVEALGEELAKVRG